MSADRSNDVPESAPLAKSGDSVRQEFRRETLIPYGLLAVRTRWFALLIGAIGIPYLHRIGWINRALWPLAAIGIIVALYNGSLQFILRRWLRRGEFPKLPRIEALRRGVTLLDIGTMLAFLYLSGGVETPFFPVFLLLYVFIGLASELPEMISLGVVTSVALASILYAEYMGWIPHFPFGFGRPNAEHDTFSHITTTWFYWSFLLAGALVLISLIRYELDQRERRLSRRREQIERFHDFQGKILATLPVGILVFGAGGRVVHANDRARELLGLALDDHRNIFRLQAIERSGLLPYVERLVGGEPVELMDYPFTVEGDQETIRWLKIVGVPPKGGQSGILLVEDITWLKEQEERELTLQERLFQADKFTSLGQMASGVAHELNNPLTAINSTAQFLQYLAKADKLTIEEVDERASNILVHVRRIEQLVKGLLAYSRPRTEESRELDIQHVIDELLSFSQHELVKYTRAFHCEVQENLPRFLGSKTELQQLTLNLLTNARHAVDRATGVVELNISHASQQGRSVLRIEVRDNGPGISPDVIDRIFEPFFTTKDSDKGTGLGLAIVHAIVERYDGEIDIQTAPGEGTRFIVELPYHQSLPEWEPSGEQTFSPYM